jgi:leader peptidase (prepilin peptidase)/N-methyltransferase
MVFDLADIAALLIGGVGGVMAGSLIHTVSVRLPADTEPLGQPLCPHCSSPLSRSMLLPGVDTNCPSCGQRSGWQKRGTEVAAALLTALSLVLHGLTFAGLTVALFNLVLLLILRIDWQRHLIYTVTIVPGLALALGAAAIQSNGALLSASIAAAAAGLVFGLFFMLAVVIYRQQALGFGDILLAALIGAMTGLSQVVPAIFLGMVLAAVGGIFLIIIGRRGRRDYIPYGAYLCAGTMLVMLFY